MVWEILAAAVILSTAVPSSAAAPTFCERMAPQLGMKPVERNQRSTGEWRANVFTATQRLLTGGSSMISFAMRPPGDVSKATVSDYLRLQSTCRPEGKEILCRVAEQMILVVSAGKAKAEVEALPGERAEVGSKGSHVFCRDPSATTAS